MFPSVGAMRRAGTTVIIEDVAFPVPQLAEATLALQSLLREHGYAEAIIFGHALEGNLHFVFTQDFNTAGRGRALPRASWTRCASSSSAATTASLKAEHGTGRNMAPFVEYEWGPQAYALMKRIKQLFDPHGLLNPGVLLNDDPQAHLQHLKPLPAADADRRQVHRVRLLRTQVPVARAHAVAAPAHRRLARDRAPGTLGRGRRTGRAHRPCAACTTTPASTPAPAAGCAPRPARWASRPAC